MLRISNNGPLEPMKSSAIMSESPAPAQTEEAPTQDCQIPAKRRATNSKILEELKKQNSSIAQNNQRTPMVAVQQTNHRPHTIRIQQPKETPLKGTELQLLNEIMHNLATANIHTIKKAHPLAKEHYSIAARLLKGLPSDVRSKLYSYVPKCDDLSHGNCNCNTVRKTVIEFAMTKSAEFRDARKGFFKNQSPTSVSTSAEEAIFNAASCVIS